MSYATIMVSLALDQPNGPRLEIASTLAERFEARLIGIAAAEFSPPVYFTSGEQAQNQLDLGLAAIKARLTELEAEFRATTKHRVKAMEWRTAMEFPANYIAQQARAADLIVAGADAGGPFSDPFALAHPSDLVMQAGRPLLIVPDSVSWLDPRSILVAWKDCPESRRAIVAALPMLCKAEEVTVVQVVEHDGDPAATLAGAEDVVAWLSGHGVSATALVPDKTGNAVKQLDGIASDVGAGLIVAGAYGHSRFREWILGGVTRHLIGHSARCALLSH